MKSTVSRMLCVLLAAIVLMGLLSFPAFAETESGRAGADITWTYADGVITFSGKGEMYDYDGVDYRPWLGHVYEIRKVVIEEGITDVGRNVFFDCSVSEVSFPASLVRVAAGAFKHCPNLESADLSGCDLACIEKQAFSNCPSLTSVSLPDVVLGVIWQDAFSGDPRLASVSAGSVYLQDAIAKQAQQNAARPIFPEQYFDYTGTVTTGNPDGSYQTAIWENGAVINIIIFQPAYNRYFYHYYENGSCFRIIQLDGTGIIAIPPIERN